MKIVGQSTLANGTPYVHLGYLAASYTQTKANMALVSGGLIALTLGVAMVFSLVVGKTASGWTALNFVRRRSKRLLEGGLALMLLGGAALALAVAYTEKEERYYYPDMVTSDQGSAILNVIAKRRKQGQPMPDDLAGLGLSSTVLTDGWRHPMRLAAADQGGLKVYSIVSAGPDGSFGTADDIRMSLGPDGQFSIDGNHRPGAKGQQ